MILARLPIQLNHHRDNRQAGLMCSLAEERQEKRVYPAGAVKGQFLRPSGDGKFRRVSGFGLRERGDNSAQPGKGTTAFVCRLYTPPFPVVGTSRLVATARHVGYGVLVMNLCRFKDLLHEVLLLGGQCRIARGVSADSDPCTLCTSGSCRHPMMRAGVGDAKQ
jgi:hypothetical protein